MGPPSYMRSFVDRNVVMRRMIALSGLERIFPKSSAPCSTIEIRIICRNMHAACVIQCIVNTHFVLESKVCAGLQAMIMLFMNNNGHTAVTMTTTEVSR